MWQGSSIESPFQRGLKKTDFQATDMKVILCGMSLEQLPSRAVLNPKAIFSGRANGSKQDDEEKEDERRLTSLLPSSLNHQPSGYRLLSSDKLPRLSRIPLHLVIPQLDAFFQQQTEQEGRTERKLLPLSPRRTSSQTLRPTRSSRPLSLASLYTLAHRI